MDLFDDVVRIDAGPALFAEESFSYYNRSAREDVRRLRAMLQRWFDAYPEEHQRELHTRFRRGFEDPFFELLVHQLLLKLDYQVAVHPDLKPQTAGRPDFRATSENGDRIVVEATLALDRTREEAAVRRVEATIMDGINQLDSPNFFVDVEIHRVTTVTPSSRDIRSFLSRDFAQLDPDDITARYVAEGGGYAGLPTFVYETEDVHLEFRPIPIRREARGTVTRPIGMSGPAMAQLIEPHAAIRTAVSKKASAYGQLGMPYVIAINALADHRPFPRDVVDALFGQEAVEIIRNPAGWGPSSVRETRLRDGAWLLTSGPINTRVSAVLVAMPASPWNVHSVPLLFVKNPWAAHPYTGPLDVLPGIVVGDEEISVTGGRNSGEILGELSPDSADGPPAQELR